MNCCIVNSITRLVDNTLLLDLGEDIGKAQIEACEISEVLDAMKEISDNGNLYYSYNFTF